MFGKIFTPETAVSIHTPPWGRDEFRNGMLTGTIVSIHTPPWGRDEVGEPFAEFEMFQFTRPRGGAISLAVQFGFHK